MASAKMYYYASMSILHSTQRWKPCDAAGHHKTATECRLWWACHHILVMLKNAITCHQLTSEISPVQGIALLYLLSALGGSVVWLVKLRSLSSHHPIDTGLMIAPTHSKT